MPPGDLILPRLPPARNHPAVFSNAILDLATQQEGDEIGRGWPETAPKGSGAECAVVVPLSYNATVCPASGGNAAADPHRR